MKTIVIATIVVWSFLVAYIAGGSKTDKDEKFIIEQLDAQIMDIEESKLAITKGTNDPIQLYGEWMQKDHLQMKKELQALAIQKNISIPTRLSNEKAEALTRLRNLEGKEFDQEFVRMMRIDHLMDIRSLKTACKSTDPDVRAFAQKYLPVLKSHLSGLEELPIFEPQKDGSK